jgi:hypothetical protein
MFPLNGGGALTGVLLGRAAASPMVEDGDLGNDVVEVGVLVAHVREVLTANLRNGASGQKPEMNWIRTDWRIIQVVASCSEHFMT